MTAISPKQKEHLQQALDSITDECSNGMDPNDAIVKVAKAMDLSEDELPLLVRGYNVGATNAQWKSSKDQQVKLAEFPIADIDKINLMLYPKQVKTAGFRKQKTDNTFLQSASSIFDGCFKKEYDFNALPMTKSASCFRDEDVTNMFKKEDAILQQVKHIQDACMLEKYAAKRGFDTKIEEFAEILQNPYAPSLEQMKKTAESLHGVSGTKLIQYTLERFPDVANRPRLVKNAEAITSDSKFYKCMNSALKALDNYIKTEVDEKKAHVKCASALAPVANSRKEALYGDEMDQILLSPEEAYAQQMQKEARTDLIPSLDEYIKRTPGPAWDMANPTERAALAELKDRSPLRNQKVKALLLDLMSSDPYLRQQDPDVITAAFNDLYEANPVDSLKRIWLKTHLPQYIASEGLDAPTVGGMIESGRNAEKAERDRIRSILDEFMNNVGLRERINANEREEEKLQGDKEKMQYQRERDTKRDKYQEGRDKKQDKDNENRLKYQQSQDKERMKYQKSRDSILDARNRKMDDESIRATMERERQMKADSKYRKERDAAQDEKQRRKDELENFKETNRAKEEKQRNDITLQKEKQRELDTQNRIAEQKRRWAKEDAERDLRKQEAENRKTELEQKEKERQAKEKASLERQNAQNALTRDRASITDWDNQNAAYLRRIDNLRRVIGDTRNARNNGELHTQDVNQYIGYGRKYEDMIPDLQGKFDKDHEIWNTPGLNEAANPLFVSDLANAYGEYEKFRREHPRPTLN